VSILIVPPGVFFGTVQPVEENTLRLSEIGRAIWMNAHIVIIDGHFKDLTKN